ncbi:MAG: PQQ-like beta-propeller repeat protein [Planctomycetota bacterium]|nr:PQQ-like beta-propeller repeat protein [Planctomycetota bacterium]
MKKSHKFLFLLAVSVLPSVVVENVYAESWPQFRGANRDGKSGEKALWTKIAENDPELLWTAEGVGSGYASVSIADGRVYTTGNLKDGQTVSAIDEGTGNVLWSTSISNGKPRHSYEGSRSTPTVDGDKLYVVGSGGSITCLESANGNLVWTKDFKQWNGKMMSGWGFSESPLVDGGLVLCTPGGADGLIVALDKQTGDEVWASKLGDTSSDTKKLNEGAGYASIVISNGGGVKQYVQLVGKGVVGVRASDGELLWRYTGVGNTTANIPTVIVDENQIFCSTGYDTGSALLELTKKGKDEVQMKEVYFLPSKTLQNKHGGMVLVDGYIYCGHGNGSGLPICVEMKSGKIAWGPQRGAGSGESSVAYADGHIVFRFQNGKVSILKASPKKYDLVRTFEPAFQEKESWSYPAIANGKLFLREQDKIMCYKID